MPDFVGDAPRIDAFPIGARDVPDKLLIPEKLYGRKAEVDALVRRHRSRRRTGKG